MRTRNGDKEQAIRRKALEMIVKEGFDGLSMQNWQRQPGVSPATIYIYFKDREDLILQLYVEASKRMADATLVNFDPSMSFSEGLKVQWINRARYCLKYPDQAFFLEQLRHSPLQARALDLMDSGFKNMMKEFVKNAIKRNELVKVPVEVYTIAFAPLYNLLNFHKTGMSIGGAKFSFSDKIMMETLALVLKALKP